MDDWNQVVEKIVPYIVKIETPDGHGTGFLCFYNEQHDLCGIATANHVVASAESWLQPIRIYHAASAEPAFLKEGDRVIFPDRERDSAVILMPVGNLKFPEHAIQLRPPEDRLFIGDEVGWLGFPGMVSELCFFSGNISARLDAGHAYLIDGVAVNGVSGGPVVYRHATEGLQIVGTISAYIANRATGESLPRLSVARDVSHLHDTTRHMKSIDEANRKKREAQAEHAAPLHPAPIEEPKTPSNTKKRSRKGGGKG
jgi:hypothetical protein